ncbi:short-chain fatty acid transporter [Helicobacter cynogastricus]|uniref:short-chain fatty acid transporter n=1 Tax=Helicobacter cynogastricus TaxID=329937 RepID=UPI000CF08706|nr:short-chain fatty acid transporter [Helicobacter cynogastricus]
MLRAFTRLCVSLASRWLPDSFVLVAILTFMVFVAVWIFTDQSTLQIIQNWGNGAWKLLAFSMQMALVLVLGQVLAQAKVISWGLQKLAQIPKNPFCAIILVSVLGMLASLINWGFGLVVSAIFAKEIAKKVRGVDYRLLIATAYSGFVVWHGGLSGSIPLTLASGGEALSKSTAGILQTSIPTTSTIFAPFNLIIVGVIFCSLPFLLASIHPKAQDVIEVDPKLLEHARTAPTTPSTLASHLEQSKLLSILLALLGFVYIVAHFVRSGGLSLNILNMIFLFAGILLHKTPIAYIRATNEAAKNTAGILIQFPFYAGIMGMMVGSAEGGVSLAGLLSKFFINIATPHTFALFTFWSAGLVNIFVPSGGGQWAVQAPIMIPAGLELGVKPAITAMAIAWGDAWTNMIQPFWALPALAIAGLGAKDIMGYCVITLIFTGFVIGMGFLLIA